MSITDLRQDLEAIRAYVKAGDTEAAARTIDRTLQELNEDRLLTTTEAAALLGIRSVNTLKLLCRRGDIGYVTRGNRTMIPMSEVERVQESEKVRLVRTLEKRHAAIDDLGGPHDLSDEEMDDLQAARPGRLPWQ